MAQSDGHLTVSDRLARIEGKLDSMIDAHHAQQVELTATVARLAAAETAHRRLAAEHSDVRRTRTAAVLALIMAGVSFLGSLALAAFGYLLGGGKT